MNPARPTGLLRQSRPSVNPRSGAKQQCVTLERGVIVMAVDATLAPGENARRRRSLAVRRNELGVGRAANRWPCDHITKRSHPESACLTQKELTHGYYLPRFRLGNLGWREHAGGRSPRNEPEKFCPTDIICPASVWAVRAGGCMACPSPVAARRRDISRRTGGAAKIERVTRANPVDGRARSGRCMRKIAQGPRGQDRGEREGRNPDHGLRRIADSVSPTSSRL